MSAPPLEFKVKGPFWMGGHLQAQVRPVDGTKRLGTVQLRLDDDDAIVAYVERMTARYNGRIGDKEELLQRLRDLVEAAPQRPEGGRSNGATPGKDRARALWIKGSAVEIKPPKWLWTGYVLRAHLNMLAGDGDVGKSFATMRFAMHITTGTPWPDGSPCPKGAVLVVPGEDDESTIAWRLQVMGGDLEQLHILQGIDIRDVDTDDPLVVRLSLTKAIHVAEIERKIKETSAILTILDPAESFLEAGTKTSDGVAVRQITNPLEDMAQHTDSTALVVVHLNKAALSDAIHRISGAQTWFNAPRAALIAGHDPESENGRRLLLPYKMNLAEKPSGFGYRIFSDQGLVWDGPATMTAKEMLKPPIHSTEKQSKKDLAKKLLHALLSAGGPQYEATCKAITAAAEIGDRTTDEAKRELGITSRQLGGAPKHWLWELPQQTEEGSAQVEEDEHGEVLL